MVVVRDAPPDEECRETTFSTACHSRAISWLLACSMLSPVESWCCLLLAVLYSWLVDFKFTDSGSSSCWRTEAARGLRLNGRAQGMWISNDGKGEQRWEEARCASWPIFSWLMLLVLGPAVHGVYFNPVQKYVYPMIHSGRM